MDTEINEENGEIEMTQRFWAVEVQPGKPINIEDLPAALHITQVALDAEAKTKGRTALVVTVNGKKTTLGSVSDAIPQFSLDLIFDDDESEIIFEAVGANKIHVAGSYIVPEGDDGELGDEFGPQFVDGEISGEDEEEEESDEEPEQNIVPPPKGKANANKQKAQAQSQSKQVPQTQTPTQQNKKRKNEEVEKTTPEAENKKPKAQTPASKPSTPKEKESPKDKNPMKRQLANGLVVEDLVLGNGKEANPGQKIGVKYVGRLTNGKQFDSSLNTPFQFRLGTGEVIKGWDEGVRGMRVGGKRKLIIPPALAYKNQRAGDIPPNSTLIFEVELVRA